MGGEPDCAHAWATDSDKGHFMGGNLWMLPMKRGLLQDLWSIHFEYIVHKDPVWCTELCWLPKTSHIPDQAALVILD